MGDLDKLRKSSKHIYSDHNWGQALISMKEIPSPNESPKIVKEKSEPKYGIMANIGCVESKQTRNIDNRSLSRDKPRVQND